MSVLYEFFVACYLTLSVLYLLHLIPPLGYAFVLSLVISSVLRSLSTGIVQRIVIVVDPDHPLAWAIQLLCWLCGCPVKDEFEVLR